MFLYGGPYNLAGNWLEDKVIVYGKVENLRFSLRVDINKGLNIKERIIKIYSGLCLVYCIKIKNTIQNYIKSQYICNLLCRFFLKMEIIYLLPMHLI